MLSDTTNDCVRPLSKANVLATGVRIGSVG